MQAGEHVLHAALAEQVGDVVETIAVDPHPSRIRDGELLDLEVKIDRAVQQLEAATGDKRELRRHLEEARVK